MFNYKRVCRDPWDIVSSSFSRRKKMMFLSTATNSADSATGGLVNTWNGETNSASKVSTLLASSVSWDLGKPKSLRHPHESHLEAAGSLQWSDFIGCTSASAVDMGTTGWELSVTTNWTAPWLGKPRYVSCSCAEICWHIMFVKQW